MNHSFQVFFFIDPEITEDPRMAGLSELALGYTFFKTGEEDLEEDPNANASIPQKPGKIADSEVSTVPLKQ